MFGGKESLEGRTTSIGGSGGILKYFGVDLHYSGDPNAKTSSGKGTYGFSLNAGAGLGVEGHIGITYGSIDSKNREIMNNQNHEYDASDYQRENGYTSENGYATGGVCGY